MMSSIGERLRAARQAKEWSLQDVAERTGWHRATISAWENGTRKIKLDQITKLAKTYGIGVHDLIPETEKHLVTSDADPRVEECPYCGNDDIGSSAVYCKKCSRPVKNFCLRDECGVANDFDAIYCELCGYITAMGSWDREHPQTDESPPDSER